MVGTDHTGRYIEIMEISTERRVPYGRFGTMPVWAAIGLISPLVALGVAFGSQLFGLRPCELCWWQRLPYALMIAAVLFGWLRPAPRTGWMLAVLLAFTESGLAGYHAAVEAGWIAGPSACSAQGAPAGDLDALRAQILSATIVSCRDVAFRFLGLSMAAWNAIYALGTTLALIRTRPKEVRDVATR